MSISPAWPVSYDDMEPYYTAAEQLYHVHGEVGEDPAEPWHSAPYPYPAVSHERRIQLLSEDFAFQGLQPFHTPPGVMLNERYPRKSPCIRCNTCDGIPPWPLPSASLTRASGLPSRCAPGIRDTRRR